MKRIMAFSLALLFVGAISASAFAATISVTCLRGNTMTPVVGATVYSTDSSGHRTERGITSKFGQIVDFKLLSGKYTIGASKYTAMPLTDSTNINVPRIGKMESTVSITLRMLTEIERRTVPAENQPARDK